MALSKSPYRGTRDFFPRDMRLRNYMFQKMAEVSEQFAYEPYDGPVLEEVELYLAKSGEELINEQIYSFKDRGDRHVAIRPEMTPTLARMVAQIHREVPKPIRMYSIPNLMRYEKPQRGRLREFWQYNADIFGAGQYGEIEILQLAVSIMKNFGATNSQFEILINDRRLVNFIFNAVFNLDITQAKKLYKLLDNKGKMSDEKFSSESSAILVKDSQLNLFLEYSSIKSLNEIQTFLNRYITQFTTFYKTQEEPELGWEIVQENVLSVINFFKKIEQSYLSEYVKFDPAIVRGLDYYTGMVFEVYDKHPENRRAIAGGGSYANLLQIFNEPALEGVGIGLGEVPLKDFLETHNLMPEFSKPELDYLVAYLTADAEAEAMKVAASLREQGKKVELFFGEAKPKKIFTYSEKKNFSFVCFIGEEELKNGEIKVKDLKQRTEQTYKIADLLEGKK